MAQLSAGAAQLPAVSLAPAYDLLESRPHQDREADLMDALALQIAHAKKCTHYFAETLAHVQPEDIRTRADLARLPLLRKQALVELQQRDPPFGGLVATPMQGLARLFCSPGPVHVPEGRARNWWRAARALHAAGFASGDLVVNTFNHHFTPAAAMMESGCRELGCVMLPTGVGQLQAQAAWLARVGVAAYVGTPQFLPQLTEQADADGLSLAFLRKALVTGGHLPQSLRQWGLGRGIEINQCYAVAEIGLIAYEERDANRSVLPGMVLDEEVLVEIVRPGTAELVPPHEVGELVVTTFNSDYPLIRYATGDLFAWQPAGTPSHRTNARISQWLGRADQSTKVRGTFIHPGSVAALLRRHPQVLRARFKVGVDGNGDTLQLLCETSSPCAQLAQELAASARTVTTLRCTVELVAAGALPDDGVVIEDTRATTP